MFWGQIILNYSKTYRISLVNQDFSSLAVTSQPPSPALTVSKSEGESLFIIGFIYTRGSHIDMKHLSMSYNHTKECSNTYNS